MNRLRDLLRAVVGELRWTPPAWPAKAVAPALRVYRRSPRASAGALAALVVLLGAGYGAWLWWKSRPQPSYLAVEVVEPAPTPLPTELDPAPKPYPLVVRYSGAAAPLDRVGKEVSEAFRVEPAVAGAWRWSNDRELVFTPASDWEVGEEYRVRFERSFFARQALLERYELTFRSPRFAARLEAPVFYEDPTDPRNKRVTATLRFTHPVDRGSLEKRIALRLRVDPVKDFRDASVQSFAFKVAYDEVGGTAYVTSDVIALPEREGEMRVEIDDGVVAARGGPGTDAELAQSVRVPSVATYFRLDSVAASVVTNEAHEMERVVTLQFTAPVRSQDLSPKVEVFELPKDKPAIGDAAAIPDHDWSNASEVVPQVLAKALKLEPTWLPAATDYAKLQAFRYSATAGRWLYVRVERGARSFGDYPLVETAGRTVLVDEMPRTIEILHEGSLLSLAGEKKLSVLVRNLRAVQLELSRVLPRALALLAAQSYGKYQRPSFRGYVRGDDLSEVFRDVHAIPEAPPGTPQYDVVDFGSFLSSGAAPRGLFLLHVREWNPDTKEVVHGASDQRLVLLTDLGFLVKDAQDGSHDVFVMSLRTGEPVADASVAILGRNGLPALSATTDATGRASLPPFKDLQREKAPTVYVVRKGNDLSFLPYDRYDRRLDFSRYDVGGLQDQEEAGSL